MEEQLSKLKTKTSKLKEDYNRAQIKLEEAYKSLEKDFGLKTVEEVESKIIELSKKVDAEKSKRDKLILRVQKKLERYEGN